MAYIYAKVERCNGMLEQSKIIIQRPFILGVKAGTRCSPDTFPAALKITSHFLQMIEYHLSHGYR
jgi:hypothetical protein